jgi:UMF1 family MFS transporter
MGHLGRHRAPAPRVPEQTSGGTSIDRSGDGASMRRGRLGWYCYDWASAVFTTVLTSVFFGPYVTSVAERAVDAQGHVRPLGIPVAAGSYFPYLVSLSVAVQIVVLPAAAALTRRHDKGRVLAVPALTGAVATLCMSATGDTSYVTVGALFVLATVALGASVGVVNTYLPVIAPPALRDRTSALASAAGFLSGGILLVASLVVQVNHDAWGLSKDVTVRLVMLGIGIWWLVFTVVAIWLMRAHGRPAATDADPATARPHGAFRALLAAVRRLRGHRRAAWFLVAFLLYNNGTQTVTAIVGTYAVVELELTQSDVIVAVLVVQFAAVAGTAALGRVAERYGGHSVLGALVIVWAAVIVAGGMMPARSSGLFMALCASAGLIVGGTYALSRSTFIGLVPREHVAEYLGIFEMVARSLTFLGPAGYALALQSTASHRTAWFSILMFLFGGGVVLLATARHHPQPTERREALPHV